MEGWRQQPLQDNVNHSSIESIHKIEVLKNNNMMAQCLKASLSTSARQSVMAHTSDYEVIPDGATQPIMVAPLCTKQSCA